MYKYLLAYCIGPPCKREYSPKLFVTFDTATQTNITYNDLSVTRKLNLSVKDTTGARGRIPAPERIYIKYEM